MKTIQGIAVSDMQFSDIDQENAKLSKELDDLQKTEKNILNHIIDSESYLVKLSRNITVKPEEIKVKEQRLSGSQATIGILHDNIENYLKSLQKNCNSSYQEKYKTQIEYLYSLPKQIKVSYIIVKKLDITEEFLMNLNIFESIK
jgi:hypothetical protein